MLTLLYSSSYKDGGASDSTWQVLEIDTYISTNPDDHPDASSPPQISKFYTTTDVRDESQYYATRLSPNQHYIGHHYLELRDASGVTSTLINTAATNVSFQLYGMSAFYPSDWYDVLSRAMTDDQLYYYLYRYQST